MSLSAIVNAQSVRARLRRPQNAVEDTGIDLKRLPRGFELTADRKRLDPPIQIINIAAIEELPSAPSPTYRPSSSLAAIFFARQIIATVAADYELTAEAITSKVRTSRFVEPRHIAMYLMRVIMVDRSLPWIGQQFGARDHSTAIHAINKTAARVKSDIQFAAKVAALECAILELKNQ